jgi:alpha-L-rhamnosidase
MPWEFYLHYGDTDMLADNYEGMKGYVRYMQTWIDEEGIMFSRRTGKDGKVLKWFNLGDWAMPPGESIPDEMVHTFYFWRCADITAGTARVLNKPEEAKQYARLAERTRAAFHNKYYDLDKGTYGRAGGNIFALRMSVPQDRYDRVIAALKSDIEGNDGHLDTGIFGTQFFFEVLSEHGLHEQAYAAMNKHTLPGYGYWLADGATTTREQWDNSGSHNHPMFGGGLVWFYRKLAGMNADPEQPGYRHIIFRPQPAVDLTFVTYSNKTPFGRAGISWKNESDAFRMDITVPVGSTATVFVPAAEKQNITESGKPADRSEGIDFLRMESGYAVYRVVSGEYAFDVAKTRR